MLTFVQLSSNTRITLSSNSGITLSSNSEIILTLRLLYLLTLGLPSLLSAQFFTSNHRHQSLRSRNDSSALFGAQDVKARPWQHHPLVYGEVKGNMGTKTTSHGCLMGYVFFKLKRSYCLLWWILSDNFPIGQEFFPFFRLKTPQWITQYVCYTLFLQTIEIIIIINSSIRYWQKIGFTLHIDA